MFRKFMVSFVVVLLLCCLVVPVFATTLIDTYNNSPQASQLVCSGLYPGDNYSAFAYHFAVSAANDEFLQSATFKINNTYASVGVQLVGAVWNSSSDLIELSSNVVSVNGYTAFAQAQFNFSATTNLTSAEEWFVGFYAASASDLSVSHYPEVMRYEGGGAYQWNSGAFASVSLSGINCIIVTTGTEGSTDTSNPYLPNGSAGTTDELIQGLMWWFVYLIVMLLPAWFLGGYLKMGKWGFLIGLAIGSGIGYGFISGFPLL